MKFLALALASGTVESAFATSAFFEPSGNPCHATQGGSAIPTQYGLNKPGPYAIEVACPVQVPYAGYPYGYFGISPYRRNPNDALSCTLNMSTDDGYNLSTAKATIANYGSARLYATRYATPSVPRDVVWVGCRIPARFQGNYSYTNSILTQVSN